jgi:DNA-binding transcriptional LysR family regulator
MDKLALLQQFIAVADAGGFSAAAAQQGVLPSVPIRAVAALEKQLRVQLFRRTTRRVAITDEGAAYARRCRAILADLHEADQQASQAATDLSGLIRVTAPVMLGRLHVAPLLAQFMNAHRKVTLDLQLNDRFVDLVDQGCDLGIRIGRLTDSTLIAAPVASVSRMVCASPHYWQKNTPVRTPSDLLSHRCVHFDGYSPHSEWVFEVQGKASTARPQAVMTTSHLDAALEACVEGVGCGVFLSYQVNEQIKAGRLVQALARYTRTKIPVSLVMPPGRLASVRIKTLRQWLTPRLAQRLEGI